MAYDTNNQQEQELDHGQDQECPGQLHGQEEEQQLAPEPAYHAKRPHKKSRNGCINCKQRKVKCNEERPECRTCVLRKETCKYPQPRRRGAKTPTPPAAAATASTSAYDASSPSSSSQGSDPDDGHQQHFEANNAGGRHRFFGGNSGDGRGSGVYLDDGFSTVVSEPQIMLPGRDMTELRLLWFYTNKTFMSFVAMERMAVLGDILKIRVVQHAFETPFLMDCLLGLTAMDMQNMDHDVDPRRLLVYQSRAFAGYRKAIEEAKPESFPGLIACSVLFTALSSGMFRESAPGVSKMKIISWIIIWRGIGLLVDIISPEELLKSGMAPLFFRPSLDLKASAHHIPDYLHTMIDTISPQEQDASDVAVYRNALRYLGALYCELSAGITPILFLQIMSWFTYLPTRFVSLIRQERPRALVIIAHVCSFEKLIPLWWMRNVGNYGVEEIVQRICPEWSAYMTVPLNAMGFNTTENSLSMLALARILLRDPQWTPARLPVVGQPMSDPRVRKLTWVDDEGREVEWKDGFKSTDPSEDFQPHWNIDFVDQDETAMQDIRAADELPLR